MVFSKSFVCWLLVKLLDLRELFKSQDRLGHFSHTFSVRIFFCTRKATLMILNYEITVKVNKIRNVGIPIKGPTAIVNTALGKNT